MGGWPGWWSGIVGVWRMNWLEGYGVCMVPPRGIFDMRAFVVA